MTIIAATGHRPEKIQEDEHEFRLNIARHLRQGDCTTLICGMASGFDLIAGTTALRIGIPVWAAKPWAGHGPRKADRSLYAEVLESASRVIDVHPAQVYPGAWVYQKRNEWMVDNAERVLAYWDGSSGGTANCVAYAEKVDKKLRNIYGRSTV
jgi:uncharacterized phage-like protein YoqJ